PDENRIVRQFHQLLDLLKLLFAVTQRLLDPATLRHIHERDDHAVDLVIDRAVWAQAQIVPAAVATAYLPADGNKVGNDRLGVANQIAVVELMREIRDRAPLVARRNPEQLGHRLGETLDAKPGIQEEGAEIGSRHQILQVAVGARDGPELELELAVDGLQLFV